MALPNSRLPDLTLAQAIIHTIAKFTGREVHATEVCAYADYLQVTVSFHEDCAEVVFDNPEDVVTPSLTAGGA
jgi:hypothetical protein